ncbi:MAG TPA: hypothetical protein VK572_13965 [Burkholderiales bacterium]|nr:hypothetical protein [Burkholderiales bacterium]
METASTKPQLWIVDLLSTLFVAFCIGVGSAVVLGACVILMAGEARGALHEDASAEEMRAKVIELALTHQLVTKSAGLIAIDRPADRAPASAAETDPGTTALPAPLPDRRNYETTLGMQGATDSRFKLFAGALMSLFATALFWQVRDLRRTRLRLVRGRRP